MASYHVLTCFLSLVANCCLMLESSKLFMINAVIIYIYGWLNLNIFLPPPYYREVWGYKNTDPVCVQRAILLVNGNGVFSNKITKQQKKKLKVSSTSYEIYLEILFLIRLSNSTISVPVG